MVAAILALQGAFAEHGCILDKLGVKHVEIRQKRDLEHPFDALIIPGGESTVIGKLLEESGLYQPIREKILSGMPVFGTCAGLILLAKQIDGGIPCFSVMDIRVKRNAYGRQLGSFFTDNQFGGSERIPMTFIRAPYIESVGNNVEVLSIVDSNIVAAQQDNMLVTAFHPELDEDLTVHQHFIRMVEQFRLKNAG